MIVSLSICSPAQPAPAACSRWSWSRTALTLSCALFACALAASAATAQVRVVDGDTFHWEGRKIRLWGIDAPERGKRCAAEAKTALLRLIGSARRLSCQKRDIDRYGREVAVCAIRGADLGLALVLAGWARDMPRYSGGVYAPPEALARQDRRGQWGDNCGRVE